MNAKWPPDWRIKTVPVTLPDADKDRPLTGGTLLGDIIAAGYAWDQLTERQRELVLSTAAGYPIAVRADVTARLVARGFLDPDDPHKLTEAGRSVVRLRP